MLNKYLLLAILLGCNILQAQKTLHKQWSAKGISVVRILADEIYNIRIYSTDDPTVKVALYIEGETNESVVLEAKSKNDTLDLQTAYSPYFEPYNDKLAAHKVVAIEMTLFVPKNLTIDLEAKLASVVTYGPFDQLLVQLNQGNGTFHDFIGNGRLMSKLGFIKLWAGNGVSGQAKSVFGEVVNELPATGNFHITAESRQGNVYLRSSQ